MSVRLYAALTSYSYGYGVGNIRAALPWINCTKYSDSIARNRVNKMYGKYCLEYSKQNIGTIKKRISWRVGLTPDLGWMVVHK